MSGQPNRILPPVRSAGASAPLGALARLGARDKAPTGAPARAGAVWEDDSVGRQPPARPAQPATPAAVEEEVITLAELARRVQADRNATSGDELDESDERPVLLSRGSSAGLAARALGLLTRRR